MSKLPKGIYLMDKGFGYIFEVHLCVACMSLTLLGLTFYVKWGERE